MSDAADGEKKQSQKKRDQISPQGLVPFEKILNLKPFDRKTIKDVFCIYFFVSIVKI
jgi:hypothetical protein